MLRSLLPELSSEEIDFRATSEVFAPFYHADAWIQTGRFQGIDKSNIIDSMTIHDDLVLAIEAVIAFIVKHAMRATDIKQKCPSLKNERFPSLTNPGGNE